jgi:hypothetical protein
MYKFLQTLHPGGIRAHDSFINSVAVANLLQARTIYEDLGMRQMYFLNGK